MLKINFIPFEIQEKDLEDLKLLQNSKTLIEKLSIDILKQKMLIAFAIKENFSYFDFILKSMQILEFKKSLEKNLRKIPSSLKISPTLTQDEILLVKKAQHIQEQMISDVVELQPLLVELNNNELISLVDRVLNKISDYQDFIFNSKNLEIEVEKLNLFKQCNDFLGKIDELDDFEEYSILSFDGKNFDLAGYEIKELSSLNHENFEDIYQKLTQLYKDIYVSCEKNNFFAQQAYIFNKKLNFDFLLKLKDLNDKIFESFKDFDSFQRKLNEIKTKEDMSYFQKILMKAVETEDSFNLAKHLFFEHIGDCVAFPMSCAACYEWLLFINTIYWEGIFVGEELSLLID